MNGVKKSSREIQKGDTIVIWGDYHWASSQIAMQCLCYAVEVAYEEENDNDDNVTFWKVGEVWMQKKEKPK